MSADITFGHNFRQAVIRVMGFTAFHAIATENRASLIVKLC
jgi:hypothetical protein